MPRRVHPHGRMSQAGKTSLPLSLLIGALLVPLAAIASVVIVEPGEPTAVEASPEPTTTTVALGATAAPSLGEDLAVACGPAGQDLVARDRDGTATQLQRAALDALRPICDAVGMPLPAVGDNVDAASIQSPTVVPVSSAEAPSMAGGERDYEDDDDEDEHEDEHEDGEWEEDD